MKLGLAKMQQVTLMPLGLLSPSIPEYLCLALADSISTCCTIFQVDSIDLKPAYHPQRRQYDALELLSALLAWQKNKGGIVLGLTDLDLFLPILTYVFGAAQLGGSVALLSSHRLHQEFYGLPANQRLTLERCEKEACHELGHVMGLLHCQHPQCAMFPAHTVDHIDNRPATLCGPCQAQASLK